MALEEIEDELGDVDVPRIERVDLERRLAELRAKEREAHYLHAVEGHTGAEIAEQIGHGRGTVLSLIYRARRKLAARTGRLTESG